MSNLEELKCKIRKIKESNEPENIKVQKIQNLIKNEKTSPILNYEKNSVLDMIANIRNQYSKYSNCIDRDFLEGGCYYFAYMLKKIYGEKAQIYICSRHESHAVTKIDNNYYDVRGKIEIDEKEYYKANEEDYLYFRDLCLIGRNKDNVKIFEKNCDEILENIQKNDVKRKKLVQKV